MLRGLSYLLFRHVNDWTLELNIIRVAVSCNVYNFFVNFSCFYVFVVYKNFIWPFLHLCVVYAECLKTKGGHEYNGTVSRTRTGKLCQRWSSNTPHDVGPSYTDDKFPDGSRKEAKNYCRNPDLSWDRGVWCYTMDKDTLYEMCNIPLCNPRKSSANHTTAYVVVQAVVKSNIQNNEVAKFDPRGPETPERISMKLGIYTLGHKKKPNYFLPVTSPKSNGLITPHFSVRFKNERHMWCYELHPPHLINVGALLCERF